MRFRLAAVVAVIVAVGALPGESRADTCAHLHSWTKVTSNALASGSERAYNKALADRTAIERVVRGWLSSPPPRTVGFNGVVRGPASAREWKRSSIKLRYNLWFTYCNRFSRHKITKSASQAFVWLFDARERAKFTAMVRRRSGGKARPRTGGRIIGGTSFDRNMCSRIAGDGQLIHRWMHGAAYLKKHAQTKYAKHLSHLEYDLKLPPARSSYSRSAYGRLSTTSKWKHWRSYCGARGHGFSTEVVWGLTWLTDASARRRAAVRTAKPVTRTWARPNRWLSKLVILPKYLSRRTLRRKAQVPDNVLMRIAPPLRAPRVPKVRVRVTKRKPMKKIWFFPDSIRTVLRTFLSKAEIARMHVVSATGAIKIMSGKPYNTNMTALVRDRKTQRNLMILDVMWRDNRRLGWIEVEYFCRGAARKPLRRDFGCARVKYVYRWDGKLSSLNRDRPRK